MTLRRPIARLARFGRDSRGYVTLEIMIFLPVVFLIFAACWVFFDVFRQQSVNQKANYAIGDLLSRETQEIDDTYIDNTYSLLKLLTLTDDTLYSADPLESLALPGLVGDTWYKTDLRITVVRYDASDNRYNVAWSAARGDHASLSGNLPADLTRLMPEMTGGTQVILVETWDDYQPTFSVGLDPFEIHTFSFTHPRYAPQLAWVGAASSGGAPLISTGCSGSCTNEDGSNNVEPSINYRWGRG